jgi:prolyl 4-hydroxylase
MSSVIQYAFLGVLGYIFAGAPLFATFSGQREPNTSHHGDVLKNVQSLVIPEKNLTCPHHKYVINIFSNQPLIVYIQSFLSEEEADHLVRIRSDLLASILTIVTPIN